MVAADFRLISTKLQGLTTDLQLIESLVGCGVAISGLVKNILTAPQSITHLYWGQTHF